MSLLYGCLYSSTLILTYFIIEAKGRKAKKSVTSDKEDGNYLIYAIELRTSSEVTF